VVRASPERQELTQDAELQCTEWRAVGPHRESAPCACAGKAGAAGQQGACCAAGKRHVLLEARAAERRGAAGASRHWCFSSADKSHACTASVARALTPLTDVLRVSQERGERLSITFSPLHDKFGVEVVGADLTRALSGEEKALLQARCTAI